MADARTDKRTLLSLKIRYKSSTLEDFIERYSNDISRGGVFIKAKKPLDVGTLLKFEFLLQDQSTLIHGVGRVVWRRDPSEGDEQNPVGMGIKFIKMDPESRALVQRIAEGRDSPGVFEQGERGQIADTPAPPADDRTKVRHVSEFLASAFEEGGAGEAATREAQAGAQRARQLSRDIGARRAMSAFGNSTGSVSQAMAEPFEELDAEEDFLDDETTRIHDYPEADATVAAGASAVPFVPERRPTPVVPSHGPQSRLETEVPDLFGPDMAASLGPSGSLEPAPGEFIDPSLLDPEVRTVPPPAGLPKGIGIPAEAFRLPTEPVPGGSIAAARPPVKGGLRGPSWVFLVITLLTVAGAGVAGWQLGIVERLEKLAAPYIGSEINVFVEAPDVAQPVAQEEDPVVAQEEDPVKQGDPKVAPQLETTVGEEPTKLAEPAPDGLAKLVVQSRPMGAFISVDGKSAGRTPITLRLKPGAQVSLSGRAHGYLPKTEQVTVQPGSTTVSLALPTLPYYVTVISDPPGARATAVGGGEIITPGEMRFKSMLSPRTITVSKDGFQTASKSLSRRDFRQESNRLATSIIVELQPEVAPGEEEPVTEEPAPVEAAPVDAVFAPEPAEAEAPEAPDTTETNGADSP